MGIDLSSILAGATSGAVNFQGMEREERLAEEEAERRLRELLELEDARSGNLAEREQGSDFRELARIIRMSKVNEGVANRTASTLADTDSTAAALLAGAKTDAATTLFGRQKNLQTQAEGARESTARIREVGASSRARASAERAISTTIHEGNMDAWRTVVEHRGIRDETYVPDPPPKLSDALTEARKILDENPWLAAINIPADSLEQIAAAVRQAARTGDEEELLAALEAKYGLR